CPARHRSDGGTAGAGGGSPAVPLGTARRSAAAVAPNPAGFLRRRAAAPHGLPEAGRYPWPEGRPARSPARSGSQRPALRHGPRIELPLPSGPDPPLLPPRPYDRPP